MKLLKQFIAATVIIKLLFDDDLRMVSILVLISMVRKVAIPIIILGGIMVFATSKARSEDYWTNTYEQEQEIYLETPTDEIETDWLLSYECLRFQRGWSDNRPEACYQSRLSPGRGDIDEDE